MKQIFLSLLLIFSSLAAIPSWADSPRSGGRAKPRVWWHWMNGNISKDGIRKDLLWMKQVGIGGFTVFDAGMQTPQVVPHRLGYMTPEWKDALSYSLALADSLGLEVTIPSSPGWSLMGGPWVTPDDAMKKLTWRTLTITGNGRRQDITLPPGFDTTGPYLNKRIEPNVLLGEVIPDDLPRQYRDICVLAVPVNNYELRITNYQVADNKLSLGDCASLNDGDLSTAVSVPVDSLTGKAEILVVFAKPTPVSALSLADGRMRGEFDAMPADVPCRLFVESASGEWQKVTDIPSGGAPVQTVSFPTVTARRFRLEIDRPQPDYAQMMMGLPVTLAKTITVSELSLFSAPRVNHSEEKAGFMATHDVALFPTPDGATGPRPEEIIDLTDRVDSLGVLHWAAPRGRWQVLRFGWSLTGRRNHPASPEATGLEIDKLDKGAWQRYFDHYLALYDVPHHETIRYMLTDSYESGATTWTTRMREEFQERRGYDLLPWLPALTGQIIASGEQTERFLNDWRTTIAELHAECYDLLTDICHRHGLAGRYTESHEHGRLYIADGMAVKRTAAIPMAAIWARQADGKPCHDTTAAADIRESASVANIYGQNMVATESFTCVGYPNNAWTFSPETLKPYADFAFANGVNSIVVHTSPHQPVDSLRPGLSLSAVGQWFDRHETWADLANVWTGYLERTSRLLQSGHAVKDILYYYGEDNNISALFSHCPPQLPTGYDFDYANADVLLNRVTPARGRLTTTTGMSYAALFIDPTVRRMSLPVLRRVVELAKAGVPVYGAAPEAPLSLSDNETEWRQLAAELEREASASRDIKHAHTLDATAPDAILSSTATEQPMFVHRKDGPRHIYWLSNPADTAATVTVSLRETAPHVWLYDPERGDTLAVAAAERDGRTLVTLAMQPHGAVFVMLDSIAPPSPSEGGVAAHGGNILSPLGGLGGAFTLGAWTLALPGQPDRALASLAPLNESQDPALRYFSGTATYRTTVKLSKREVRSGRYTLDLGEVKNIARVSVNGHAADTLWHAPFTLDITPFVRSGENTIEVCVTNLWPNRIIGDLQPGANPTTYISMPYYTPNAPLLRSGLIGQVWLKRE